MNWQEYEIRRRALEKKWAKRVFKALNKQVKDYVESYKKGQSYTFHFGGIIGLLYSLYGNVGGYYARAERRGLKRDVRAKSFLPSYQVKRAGLGYSEEWAQKIIDRLRMSGLSLAQKISDTTRKKVLLILESSQKENLSIDETADRIIAEVGAFNRSRALTIARTEIGRASGEGKMEGAKSLGVELDKIWISAEDFRVRRNPTNEQNKGDHWKLNEQRVPLDQPFTNGVHRIMQPGDKNAPASETIRCRCTVTFKVKKDEQGKAIRRQYYDVPTVSLEMALTQ